jgi:diadenosine tetraphosphate (Ap4A) HIT family hydrolase
VGTCFICDKHADLDHHAPGGAVIADDHVVVSHFPLMTPAGTQSETYLGYLFVEPRRHVGELGELGAAEAASLGRLTAAASRALAAEGAEHVYAAVIGHGVDHLHLHLVPRYPRTPRDYCWTRVDEWPEAPRGDADSIAAFVAKLRGHLT